MIERCNEVNVEGVDFVVRESCMFTTVYVKGCDAPVYDQIHPYDTRELLQDLARAEKAKK